MAPFTIAGAQAKILEGWGINLQAAQDAFDKIAAEFPDLAERERQFAEWVKTQLAPALDPATMLGTISGVVHDIVAGSAGVDPHAWQGFA